MSSASSTPRARPPATWTGATLAVLAIAFAAATVRDLAVAQRWISGGGPGRTWTSWLVGRIDGLTASSTIGVIGLVVAVIGVTLIATAVTPGSRTHERSTNGPGPAGGDAQVWVRPAALAGLAVAAAERTPGVFAASAAIQRRSVVVRVETADSKPSGALEATVHAVVERAVGPLTDRRILVRRRQVSHS